jgi:hypothetical protein
MTDLRGWRHKARSTSGYIFTIAGGPVNWSSRKQSITAASTAEVEYVAAADAAKQTVWIRHFLYAVHKHQIYGSKPTNLLLRKLELTQLNIDNQGALALASNPINHLGSKHIQIRYHIIRDFIEYGEIQATYIPTEHMLADSLTKVVKPDVLIRMVKSLHLDE